MGIRAEFSDYPAVCKAIEYLMADNGMGTKPGLANDQVPVEWVFRFEMAEIAADRLKDQQVKDVLMDSEIDHADVDDTDNALEVFTNGETSVVDKIKAKMPKTCEALHEILNSVFEGDLYDKVVQSP